MFPILFLTIIVVFILMSFPVLMKRLSKKEDAEDEIFLDFYNKYANAIKHHRTVSDEDYEQFFRQYGFSDVIRGDLDEE
jgi:hypothetical protein